MTSDLAVLGLCGPHSGRLASALGGDWMHDIGYFAHAEGSLGGVAIRAARLSYVGEAGWELTCVADDAKALFAALEGQGALPVGAFAQTSMRIEKGFLAYGHDLDTDVTPSMAGLEFALAGDKDFIGRTGLAMREAAPSRLVSLTFDDDTAVPLGNEPVLLDGTVIGKTTSAAFGYRVGCPVAIALVGSEAVGDGVMVEVDVAGHRYACRMSVGPLYDPAGERMRRTAGS